MKLVSIIFMALYSTNLLAEPRSEDSNIPMDVSYCQLLNDPLSFVGKSIRIRAIYRYALDLQYIEAPLCCSEPPLRIWVEMGLGLSSHAKKAFRKIDKGKGIALVVFVGRFESMGSHIVFNKRFRLTVTGIEKVEKTSKSPLREDNPSWVPKNCEPSKTQ